MFATRGKKYGREGERERGKEILKKVEETKRTCNENLMNRRALVERKLKNNIYRKLLLHTVCVRLNGFREHIFVEPKKKVLERFSLGGKISTNIRLSQTIQIYYFRFHLFSRELKRDRQRKTEKGGGRERGICKQKHSIFISL